mmetsp:Transcript_74520/g.188389  ORF Transcript_74520/g.188389 Transcript_74520/m.188389 type:complete len:252 (-) Transcript_74520:163-918(-)
MATSLAAKLASNSSQLIVRGHMIGRGISLIDAPAEGTLSRTGAKVDSSASPLIVRGQNCGRPKPPAVGEAPGGAAKGDAAAPAAPAAAGLASAAAVRAASKVSALNVRGQKVGFTGFLSFVGDAAGASATPAPEALASAAAMRAASSVSALIVRGQNVGFAGAPAFEEPDSAEVGDVHSTGAAAGPDVGELGSLVIPLAAASSALERPGGRPMALAGQDFALRASKKVLSRDLGAGVSRKVFLTTKGEGYS